MEQTVKNIRMNIFCGVYALFYTFCLYKNYRGVTFPFFAAGTLCFFLYYMKKQGLTMKKYSAFLMTAIMALSINICSTDSVYLVVFNRAFIFVLFFTLFLTNLYDDSTWDTSRYIAAIASTICSLLVYLPRPVQDMIRKKGKDREENTDVPKEVSSCPSSGKSTIGYVILGLVITLPILLIVLPLLASSDAVFSNLLERMFSIDIDMDFIGDLFGTAFMIICIFFISYAMICRFTDKSSFLESPVSDKRTKNPVVAITISTVLLIVYGLYCAIQIVYLFMGYGTLPEGYTYAEYVHEGFYQLVFVCIINLILVLMCRKYSQDNMILKIMLTLISACTFIMIFSSAYRMMLYIGAYGLTFLRLYVLWALTVIFLAMMGTCIYIYAARMPFYKYSLIVLTFTWAIFALARPDYHIARYNLTHDLTRDEYYLTHDLSADAAPAIMEYANDDELIQDYLEHLPSPKLTLRTWNYSLYTMDRFRGENTSF